MAGQYLRIPMRGLTEVNVPRKPEEAQQWRCEEINDFLVDSSNALLRPRGNFEITDWRFANFGNLDYPVLYYSLSQFSEHMQFGWGSTAVGSGVTYKRLMFSNFCVYYWLGTTTDGIDKKCYQYTTGTVSTSGTKNTAVTLGGGGHWVTTVLQYGNTCVIKMTGDDRYFYITITDDLHGTISLHPTATAVTSLSGVAYTLYVGHHPYIIPRLVGYGDYFIFGGNWDRIFVTNDAGSFLFKIPGDTASGGLASANASFISNTYTCRDFAAVDGYLIIIGGATLSNTTATPPAVSASVCYNRVRWTAPGTYDDFTSYGSGYMDISDLGSLITCAAVNHNVIIGGLYGIGILASTGDVDYPFSYLKHSGVVPVTPIQVVNNVAYWVDDHGDLYSSDGVNVERICKHFNFKCFESNTTAGVLTVGLLPNCMHIDEVNERLIISYDPIYYYSCSTTADYVRFAKVYNIRTDTVTTIHWDRYGTNASTGKIFTIEGGSGASIYGASDQQICLSWTNEEVTKSDNKIAILNSGKSFEFYENSRLYDQWLPTIIFSELNISEDQQISLKQIRFRYMEDYTGESDSAKAGIQIRELDASYSTYYYSDLWRNSGSLETYCIGDLDSTGTPGYFYTTLANMSKLVTHGSSLYAQGVTDNRPYRLGTISTGATYYTATPTPQPTTTQKCSVHLMKTLDHSTVETIYGETAFGFNCMIYSPQVRLIVDPYNNIISPIYLDVIYETCGKRKLK